MFRAIARSAAYDSDCWTGILRTLVTPVSTSTLLMVLVAALLFLGVVPAPILLWFSLGLVCAAVCLKVTRPDQFHDASQASGSFALSLLTGAPRSETASLLLLPPSHSGLLHLAMLDRDWLSAGGSLLCGSPGKSNRLTDQDLALLSTHVHDVNCKHCNLSSSSSTHFGAAQSRAAHGAPPSGALSAAAAAAAAAAAGGGAAAAAAGSQLCQPYAPDRRRQYWSSGNLQQQQQQQQQGAWGLNSSSNGSCGALAATPASASASLPPLPPSGALQQQQQQQHNRQDSLDWFSLPGGQISAAPAAAVGTAPTASAAAAAAAASGRIANVVAGHSSSSNVGAGCVSGSSSSSSQLLPLPQWGVAAATVNPPNSTTISGNSSSSSTGWAGNAAAGWIGPADATHSVAQLSAATSTASRAAAAAITSSSSTQQHWPNTGASAVALAALSAHQTSLCQSSFHQSLLKAWGSYASLDSLDDSNSSVCSICLGSYKPGGLVTSLPCGHMYHKDCVMPWLLQQGRRRSTCPMCKADVFV